MADETRVEVTGVTYNEKPCPTCGDYGDEYCPTCHDNGVVQDGPIIATLTGRGARVMALGESYSVAMLAYDRWLSGGKERGEPGPYRERCALDVALADLRAFDAKGGTE